MLDWKRKTAIQSERSMQSFFLSLSLLLKNIAIMVQQSTVQRPAKGAKTNIPLPPCGYMDKEDGGLTEDWLLCLHGTKSFLIQDWSVCRWGVLRNVRTWKLVLHWRQSQILPSGLHNWIFYYLMMASQVCHLCLNEYQASARPSSHWKYAELGLSQGQVSFCWDTERWAPA